MEGRVGETVEVKVKLENNLLEPVEDCRLLVKLDQDSSGRLINTNYSPWIYILTYLYI